MKVAPLIAIATAAGLVYYAWSTTMPAAVTGTAEDLAEAAEAVATTGPLDLADLHGQPVVLNFWAPWCPPCRAEIPEFAAYADDHADVTVLGIAVDAGPEDQLPRAAARFGITYPVYAVTDDMIAAYGIAALPTTVILGADGEVSSVHSGMMTGAQLARAVDAAR